MTTRVSEDTEEAIFEEIATDDEPRTVKQIAAATNYSASTVRTAVWAMLKDETVERFTGPRYRIAKYYRDLRDGYDV